ncbi:MAG: endonuclease/exonuclease/phosphatase family protein [Duncaniella sp.]|nr:endonuclease/exonuclease/phosphatase family protein [Duncaniella sp.]MDE5953551.1 endonuclease/exonuclease/phosphatase family protein [Duncaniella sp.]MDE6188180.1 endonuclease/exonuclease/phosphatase family protein [Duncaniella sp.]
MKFPTPHKPVRSTILALGVGLNLAVAMLTIFSAYGGTFNPEERVIASMAAMVLPLLLIAGIVLSVIDLLFDKRLILVIAAGWTVSLPSILVFSPLHFWKPSLTEQQQKDSFTFLTYNVLHFWDFRGEDYPGVERNETLDYILSTDADVVNIQEYDVLDTKGPWKIKESQVDSLKTLYPYQYTDLDLKYALFSKYPFEQIELHTPREARLAMLGFKLNIKGHEIHLINVHLKSIGLTPEDKTLYKEALDLPATKSELKRELKEVKSQLLSKLSEAFKIRTIQARTARNIVDSIGGPFIVAGDFNDIPNCYAVRTIKGKDMHDAYAEAAFGPTITYHGDKFYFRIDQILYRGPFKAVDIERGDISSSDHNPLLATFVFDPEKQ